MTVLSGIALKKSYPGVQALKFANDARLDFMGGQIHALVGENGAGKTTLVSILSGGQSPTSGQMTLSDHPYHPRNISEARLAGVEIVLQDPCLVPGLTIAENLFLSRERSYSSYGLLNPAKKRRLAEEAVALVGLEIPVGTAAEKLNVEQRKFVELARALSFDPAVLIVDEMTASVSERGRRKLFDILLKLRRQGKTIIYISHYLEEVFEITDRISVLKDGDLVRTLNTAETNEDECSVLMVGRATRATMFEGAKAASKTKPDAILSVRNLSLAPAYRSVSFDLHTGEIVGVGGLISCGSEELALSLFGALKPTGGEIRLRGEPVRFSQPRDAIAHGVAYVPKEREREGLILRQPIKDNIILPALPWQTRLGFISASRVSRIARLLIHKLGVACRSANEATISLSGGNRQKVVLAKWMVRSNDVLILNNPTRGIDVGAKTEIYRLIRGVAREGAAVVLFSDELPELIGMSDRLLIMRRGGLSLELSRDQNPQEEEIIRYMT